jgi:hypothetical protein
VVPRSESGALREDNRVNREQISQGMDAPCVPKFGLLLDKIKISKAWIKTSMRLFALQEFRTLAPVLFGWEGLF